MQRWSVLLVFALLAGPAAQAQTQTGRITGTVTVAPGGQPLVGANLVVLGTTVTGSTGPDGRFLLPNVPAGRQVVRAARIGYAPDSQVVTVVAGQPVTAGFQLTAQAIQLSGVVTVGYGTQNRREVTGAVSTLKADALQQVVSANPLEAMKGRIPGVDITAGSFEPGAANAIRIRGTRPM